MYAEEQEVVSVSFGLPASLLFSITMLNADI